jgi:hypothetical protein
MPPTYMIPDKKNVLTAIYELASKPDPRFLLGFVSGFIVGATLFRAVRP